MADLDNIVDRVAQEMTEMTPSPNTRSRVLEHLDTRQPARWGWMISVASATTAVVVAAMIWNSSTRPQTPSTPAPLARVVVKESAAPPRLTSTNTTGPDEHSQRPIAKASLVLPAVAMPSSEDLAWQARAIPALPEPEALTIASIQPEPLSVRPLEVKALDVPALPSADD